MVKGVPKESITNIDFCLDDIGKMDWIIYFPSLRELSLACQGITEIEVSLAQFVSRHCFIGYREM